jgi:hypothetical protein
MCSDEILPCVTPTHQVRVLASGDHKVCIARDPPLPIRLLAEQSECIPGPTGFVAIRRGQHYFDAIAYESPLAKDLQFQDLLVPSIFIWPMPFAAAANASFPNGSSPGTMKVTSSVIRLTTVETSPLLLAVIQVSTTSRIALSSAVISVSLAPIVSERFRPHGRLPASRAINQTRGSVRLQSR